MNITQSVTLLNLLSDLNVTVSPEAPLSNYTTFRLGGPCPYLVTCRTPLQLEETIHCLLHENLPFILIGCGSNLVVADEGVPVIVLRFFSERPLVQQVKSTELVVSGSTLLDDLSLYAARHGLVGLNCVTGIPGTVGGAVAGNAGAWGQQIGDVVISATTMSKKGIKRETSAEDLQFSYRASVLKQNGDILLCVRLRLKKGNKEQLLAEREDILRTRAEKHPDWRKEASAGSIFRNIEPTSKAERRRAAGWFLEEAGAKNWVCGGARIYPKHANIIVSSRTCKAQHVYDLIDRMSSAVRDKFNMEMVREVRFVGRFAGMPEGVKNIVW